MYINKSKPYLMKIEGEWKHYANGYLCSIKDIFKQLEKDSSEDFSKYGKKYQIITNPFRMNITMSNKGNVSIKLCSKNKTLTVLYKNIYELYKIFDFYEETIVSTFVNYKGKKVLISYETNSVIEL